MEANIALSGLPKRAKLLLALAGVGGFRVVIPANRISDNRGRWHAWSWLCPWAMLGLAMAILFVVGVSIWTALLAALLLVCPATILWGAIQVRRQRKR